MNMRLLILAADFKPSLGGIAEYTHQMALHLHKMGDDVLVLARPAPGDAAFDAGCPYSVRRALALPHKRSFGQAYRTIAAAAAEHGAQLILSNVMSSEPTAGRLAAWRLGIVYGIFVYGSELQNYASPFSQPISWSGRLKKWLISVLALKRADVVVAISTYTRAQLAEMGVSDGRIVLVPPGINFSALPTPVPAAEARTALDLAAERPMILTLGRLVRRKGIDTALRAFSRMAEEIPDAYYVVAGDGPDRARLERLAEELGLEGYVDFVGRVSEAEKALYYSAADLFIMPNRELEDGDVEGFGIVFLEANAYGTPVIGGRSGGAPEAVRHEETGLLVDPLDVEAVTGAMRRLLENPEFAQCMGERGRQRVLTEMNYEQVAHRFRQKLLALVNPNSGLEAPA